MTNQPRPPAERRVDPDNTRQPQLRPGPTEDPHPEEREPADPRFAEDPDPLLPGTVEHDNEPSGQPGPAGIGGSSPYGPHRGHIDQAAGGADSSPDESTPLSEWRDADNTTQTSNNDPPDRHQAIPERDRKP